MSTSFAWGAPLTGKTYKGCEEVAREAGRRNVPALFLDPVGDAPVEGAVFCGNDWEAAIRVLWTEGRHAHFVPASEADNEIMIAAVLRGKNVAVLWDEVGFWSDGRSCGERGAELIRTARHHNVFLFACSQYAGDLPAGLLNCAMKAYVFRNQSWRAVDRIEKEYGFAPDQVRALPDREFLLWEAGAQKKPLTPPPAAP